jgi:hypothetical protein
MMSQGRECARCQVYFVTDDPDERLCFRCRRIEEGSGQSSLLAFEDFHLRRTLELRNRRLHGITEPGQGVPG